MSRRVRIPPVSAKETSVRFSQRAQRTCEQPIAFFMKQAVANPGLISLAAGLVDTESLPVEETREILRGLLSEDGAARHALQYGTTDGYDRLRELAVAHVEALEGRPASDMSIDPSRVIVTTGSQQLLYIVSDILLDPGDIVLVGAPEYFVYMGTLESIGARVVGVPMDEQGIIPEALSDVLADLDRSGQLPLVKLLYYDSYYQNPSGVTSAPARRPEILEAVERWSRHGRIFILEDAAYRELCYEGTSPRSIRSYDRSGRTVILAQTFSKSFSPGLKTGYSILPEELVGPILQQKGNHDFGSCNFVQHLLAEAFATGRHAEHVGKLKRVYRAKLSAMLEALETAFASGSVPARWTRPQGGLYVWLVLPEEFDTRMKGPLFQRCIEKGVLYVPGEYCFPPETNASAADPLGGPRNTMRLTFGNLPAEKLREAIHRLADALESGPAAS